MGKPHTKWSFQDRRVSKFKLNKMGCRHFMTVRLFTIDTMESSCVYCGAVVRYEIPNKISLDRGTRVEGTIKSRNNQKDKR